MDRLLPRLRVLGLVTGFVVHVVGCSTSADAVPDDAAPDSDLHVDAGSALDAGPDTGAILDAGSRPDSGDEGDASPTDSGSPEDAGSDAGPVDASIRADAGELPDAGPPPAPDAGPADLGPPGDAGCIADGYEPNDTPETAALVRTGTGWPWPDGGGWPYEMTWHDGDVADWISADLDSSGIVGTFRVSAVERDARSIVEIRVHCSPGGVRNCVGSGTFAPVGGVCIVRRAFNAFADVGCVCPGPGCPSPAPSRIQVEVGSIRTATSAACGHALRVYIGS